MKQKVFFMVIFLLIPTFYLGSESYNLHFYGVLTNSNDDNMIKITQDLIAAQIRSISSINLIDERDADFKEKCKLVNTNNSNSAALEQYFLLLPKNTNPNELSFFAQILNPQSNEIWLCTFCVKNHTTNENLIFTREYDSYYKILTDAKPFLQDVMAKTTGIQTKDVSIANIKSKVPQNQSLDISMESLAGTWQGEQEISKIVILRSGRGFVIFTNGASMNVNISIVDDFDKTKKLKIVQEGKFNASFFPEISRQMVLEVADKAPPIEWNLTLTDTGDLKGTKKTLVAKGNNIAEETLPVTWSRKIK